MDIQPTVLCNQQQEVPCDTTITTYAPTVACLKEFLYSVGYMFWWWPVMDKVSFTSIKLYTRWTSIAYLCIEPKASFLYVNVENFYNRTVFQKALGITVKFVCYHTDLIPSVYWTCFIFFSWQEQFQHLLILFIYIVTL